MHNQSSLKVRVLCRHDTGLAPHLVGLLAQMRMSDPTKLIPEIVKVETIKLESALNTEEVTMSDGFHRSLISLFRAESLMNAAQ